MNINNINPYLGMQNAINSDAGNGSSADNRQVYSADEGQSTNLTSITDPPFLPMARYQRANLIKKVESEVVVESEHKISDQRSQNTVSDIKAKANETDAVRTVTSKKNQPGAILSVKI
jgi:hypothetical protein